MLGKGVELTTEEQAAIEWLCSYLGVSRVLPHNALSRKSCPGPTVTAWIRERWGSV